MSGPLSLVNHSCNSNLRFTNGNNNIVFLKSISKPTTCEEGNEIFAKYFVNTHAWIKENVFPCKCK